MGQDPPPLPEMRRPGVGCAINSPPSIEPQYGKIPQNLDAVGLPSSISRLNDAWNVLKHDPLASHHPNDLPCLGPEVPIIVKSFGDPTGAGLRVRLAGEPGRDDVNVSSPGSGIEGLDVVPDGSGIEAGRVILEPLLQDPLGVFVVLDVADRPGPDSGESAGQGESPVS